MFRQTKRRIAGRKNFEKASYLSSKLNALYSTRLSFYDIPPLDEITLEEFELWAIDRLRVLIEIESCAARNKSLKEIEQVIKPVLNKYLPLSPLIKDNEHIVSQERRKDHYSHFILRLVFCRSEDLRRKFIKNEVILFKIRYNSLQTSERTNFIMLNNDKLNWNYISEEEKLELFDQLYSATSNTIRNQMMLENDKLSLTSEQLKTHIKTAENFIKLPFEKIPNLVSSRSIYLSRGYGYIPSSLQLNLLVIEYQDNLTKNLVRTFQSIPRLEEDDRLLPLLNNLSHNFSSIGSDIEFGAENAGDINHQSIMTKNITKHYPLCAKQLQNGLAANHHLRHTGRLQLSLFLKGIGLNVDEAIKFWTYQFTTGPGAISVEKFNKEYRYNVRHLYGLEGSRVNYKPWDCGYILSRPKPTKNEYHGCPYRDLHMDALVSNLNDMGITDQKDVNAVLDDVNQNNYTFACTRVFELTHKHQLKGNENLHISHPNLYFERSKQLEKAQESK